MGDGVLWHYPDSTRQDGGGRLTLEEITLGEPIGLLEHEPYIVGDFAESVSGARSIAVRMHVRRVTLGFDRISSASRIAKLYSLESALRRGGVVAFSTDPAKAWAGYLNTTPRRGDTTIRTNGNPWGSLSGSTQALASGDQIWISSPSPESAHSVDVVSAFASDTTPAVDRITLTGGITFTPQLSPCLARHYGFFPALVMEDPIGGEGFRLTSDGRTLSGEITLIEHLPTLARAARLPAGYYLRSAQGGYF
jgi:hypothetical protein